ncbi:magnesium-protoporphyrin IX monomethyl ester cyclase, partial [Rhizobium ruizarguesonis]
RRVWFHEILEFLFRLRHLKDGPTLENFWGAPQDSEEEWMLRPQRHVKSLDAAE